MFGYERHVFVWSAIAAIMPILAALALGALCSLAWLTHSGIVCIAFLAVSTMLFMVWPVICFRSIRHFAKGSLTWRHAFVLCSVVSLLCVPVFGMALDTFVLLLRGHHIGRLGWVLTFSCGFPCVLGGMWDMRRALLLLQAGIKPSDRA